MAILSALQTSGRSWAVVFGASALVAVIVLVAALATVDRSAPSEPDPNRRFP